MVDWDQYTAVKGPRNRKITSWYVVSAPANTMYPNGTYHIAGFTVSENDQLITDRVRVTTTSPIIKCEGNTVTTMSGSKYELLIPSDRVDWEIDTNQYVPDRYITKL